MSNAWRGIDIAKHDKHMPTSVVLSRDKDDTMICHEKRHADQRRDHWNKTHHISANNTVKTL